MPQLAVSNGGTEEENNHCKENDIFEETELSENFPT